MSFPNFPFDGSRQLEARLEARLDALHRSAVQLIWILTATSLLTGAIVLILVVPNDPAVRQWIGSIALVSAAGLLLKAINFFPW